MRRGGRGTELVLALGQCDGERLQAIADGEGRLLDGSDPVHGGDGDRIEAVGRTSPPSISSTCDTPERC